MESFERRIATHGDQSRHLEHASDGRRPPQMQRAPLSLPLSKAWVQGQPELRPVSVHAAELRQERNQRASQDRADPRSR